MQSCLACGIISMSGPAWFVALAHSRRGVTMGAQVEPALLGSHFLNGNPVQPHHSPPTSKGLQLEAKESPSTTLHKEAWKPPPSAWKPQCHPCAAQVARIVDDYYLEHWPFPNERSKQKFLDAGFSRVTCLYFPTAKDNRIEYACRLLTVLFLIDGEQSGISSSRETHSGLQWCREFRGIAADQDHF